MEGLTLAGERQLAGDILVTRVANHYHIGRAQAEGAPLVTIDGANDREVALMVACRLVTGTQRLFLCALASKPSVPRDRLRETITTNR